MNSCAGNGRANSKLGGVMEPSVAAVRVEDVQGMPVRIANPDTPRSSIPLNDIADNIGYDRSTLRKLVKRNRDVLKEDELTVLIASSQGAMETTCLTLAGTLSIMSKIDYLRVKNPEKKEKIIKFQIWVKKTLDKEMQVQTKIPVERGENWSSVAIGHLDFAKRFLADNPDADPTMTMQIALRQAERSTGMDLSAYRKLIGPAPVQFQQEYLTASEIGREVGRTAAEVNRYLTEKEYLYRSDGTYYLTNLGAQYGRVFAGSFDSGHNGYYIKWKRSVIAASKMRENSPLRIREDGPRY